VRARLALVSARHSTLYWFFAILFVAALGASFPVNSQQLTASERERGHLMLKFIKEDIKEHYYDPAFHGLNLDESFKNADHKIEQATSNSQIFAIIAQTLLDFKDSHTFFLPPRRGFSIEYGWKMQTIGDGCYVTVVKAGSDAETKGLRPGDTILSVDDYKPSRENLWILNYLFRGLWPRKAQRLIVQSPGGQPRQLDIASKVKEAPQILDGSYSALDHDYDIKRHLDDYLRRDRFQTLSNAVLIWKMPQFDQTEKEIEGVMGRVKKYPNLILDLRGNRGGYVETLQHLVGCFLGAPVKIADVKGRKETKPMMARKVRDAYEGKLVVLIDSDSASAAEIFARVMQLEKRATVIGDRSSGSVMEARGYPRKIGMDRMVFFATSITDADVIMTDGKSLEHLGAIPDELLLPTGADLAAGRDPVLVRAAALLGVIIEPDKAGLLFPVEWPK
jgi:C-terminal processing protease CtpA/Prc